MELRFKEVPTEQVLRDLAVKYPEMNVSAMMAATRLFRFCGEFEKALEVNLARHDISLSRFSVLMTLRRYGPDGLKPTELAEKISVTRGNMTGLLDGLEKSGLIRREDCKTDRRIVYIKLSEVGEKFLEKILPDHYRRVSACMTRISGPELEKLAENIEKCREGISALLE